ncbi:zinc finger protein 585B [Diorhabda sublineata]|uniref:zinc finger protein 585B n=1 Tax=Diorhabda sublineata TaxID=1163346 RepID=UPI0024E08A4E|nr:zinc finger protein 585B [Diorhabda sublineata]
MMITEYEEDTHFCIKCHITILGLENYINHRKAGCSKNLTESPKSPLPSQLLPPDESFNLKADDFFSSLELRSSSKKPEGQSTQGKTFSGILTRSKTTAVIQASSSNVKDQQEPQQSKSGKNVWIGGHQLKELGYGDNQSKLIKAVDNLERRKEEPQKLEVFQESDEDSEEYDYDEDDSSTDDQDGPPRNHTGGKWKPSSPIQWTRNNEGREWNHPPPSFTGGKWKPKRSTSPPVNYTKGKWKPSFSQKDDYSVPPPTFTGSKWVSKKTEDLDVPPPNFTGSKWVASKRQDPEIPPPTHTKGKWKPRGDEEQFTTGGKGKWKPGESIEDDIPPVNYTKGKWKPRSDIEDEYPPPTHTKGKWKPRNENDEEFPSTSYTKEKWKQKATVEMEIQASHKSIPTEDAPEENYTKGKWIPSGEIQNKFTKKITDNLLLRKSSGAVQYWCAACNRRLASKVVYERHLKSELHFKRTSGDGEFDETDELALIKEARRTKLKPPEYIFSNQEQIQPKKRRQRYKKNQKSEVYPCNKEDIEAEAAKAMILGNVRDVVLESPYQCSPCKFFCNSLEDLLRHWLSSEHKNNPSPGYFHCNICKHRAEDTEAMHQHLISTQHAEMTAINRSVPIVIKKYNPTKCPTCNEEFLLNMQLLNHCKQFQHDDTEVKKFKNEYICDICGEGLLSNMSLRRHKHIIHKQKYFICTPCNLKFDDINEAKLHRKSQQHKYKSLEKQNCTNLKKKCQYCDACFGNFLLLKQHLRSDHPEHNVRCPHCGATFTITQELTTHLRLKQCKFEEHPETIENSLQCEKCPFYSNSISELFFHIALHEEPLVNYQNHTESSLVKAILKYKCPVCENFYPKASLQGHIRQHTQDRPFVCTICGKSFARKNNLQFHMKNHEKKVEKARLKQAAAETSFLCCTCGANFKKKSILQQHMQTHTGKLCKCPHTGCIFTARKMSEINEHCKIHSDDKNFSCDLCDYKGKTKSLLAKHMKIHREIRKFQCKHCSFTTRNTQHLRRHIRIHTGAKPFSCPHCDYKCSNLENLRKHVLSTNKHIGKFLYECKFCTEGSIHFQSNFAKDFKVHLVTEHAQMFDNSNEATSYIAGIYDVHNDIVQVFIETAPEQKNIQELPSAEDRDEEHSKLNTDDDPVVCQPETDVPSTSGKDHLMQRLIIPKYDCDTVENLPDSWSLVGKYDVEEASGTLIPFESDSESLFQEHFQ